jgi:L-ascorbate metabolism protein UlaG (beta-lactamase superfamily)
MKAKILALLMPVLFLLSACKPALPVATPIVPLPSPTPTSTPSLTGLITTNPPTSTIEPVPVDPSSLRITYTCNDGFIITACGKKILIDTLFRDSGGICLKDLEEEAARNQHPFDNADLVLISHTHWDHFDLQIVGAYLQSNPQAILVSEKPVGDELRVKYPNFVQVQEQVQSVDLGVGESIQMIVQGINLEIISAPSDVSNLGFIIHIGEYTLFHSGDSGSSPEMTSQFLAYQLPGKNIDVAFIPYWYLLDPQYHSTVEEDIQAKYYIPMHYAGENINRVLNAIKTIYPQAITFYEEMQTWIHPLR